MPRQHHPPRTDRTRRKLPRKKNPSQREPSGPARSQTSLGLLSSRSAKFAAVLRLLGPETARGRWMMAAILLVAFLLRVTRLMEMFPVLVDESIYMHWAEIIEHQGQWFISLLDGKQPLQYWVLAVVRMIFGGDPLLEGRLVSVVAGLLSTVGVFAIGKRLGGNTAGLISASLYAVFPFALLYDRLAYTEAFVNLNGIAITLTALLAFGEPKKSWTPEIAAGLALGLALFTKQTTLLFIYLPLIAGLWLGRGQGRSLLARWGLMYGIAGVFVFVNWAAMPEAPTLETHDTLLHHKQFYVPLDELMRNPFRAASKNARLLIGYIGSYVTWPVALAGLTSLLYLSWRRSFAPWVLISISVPPLVIQCVILSLMYPTRWAFPHFWPWLVVIGLAASDVRERYLRRLDSVAIRRGVAAAAALCVAGPMLYQAQGMIRSPREFLHTSDATGFLGSHAHVGFGNREAIEYLIAQARERPLVLLTDAIWGPPADAMFPYLNMRHGIRVYEAWWMQLAPNHPILPPGPADIMRSHYERVHAGVIDFSKVSRVFYVTDTFHKTKAEVQFRQPGAKLVASFPKPDDRHFIDVYQLK